MDPVVSIAILLAAALVGGMIAHRLRQPVILGYIVIGILVGPHALGLVDDPTLVEATATIGVALLMFTLGLEVSIDQLRQVGKVGLWGGVAQVTVTLALGTLAGLAERHKSFVLCLREARLSYLHGHEYFWRCDPNIAARGSSFKPLFEAAVQRFDQLRQRC